MKIVVNRCFGGYSLSTQAMNMYRELSGNTDPEFKYHHIERNDPIFVDIVERLGEDASGPYGYLEVFEIPDGLSYEISEYDGLEDFITYLEVGVLDLINGFDNKMLELAQKANYIKLI